MGKVQKRSDYPEQKTEKKPNKVKAKVTETVTTTATIVKNAEQLVIATALLIVTVFAYTESKAITNDVWFFAVTASVAIVGVMAFWQFVTFLKRK